MSIKLIAIDMDGTMLNSHHAISPRVKEMIKTAKDHGIKVAICTGRPYSGAAGYFEELGLSDDFVICYNGAIVQHIKSGEQIAHYSLTHEDFLEIDTMARRLDVHLHLMDDKFIYTSNRDISPYTVRESFLVGMPVKYRTQEEITPDFSIIKMMMIDEETILDEAIAKLPDWFFEKYTALRSADFYFEILNKETDKGRGLERLAEHLGISQSETMAIGDNENDLAMIRYAGTGVAMGNAIQSVKDAADVIVADNDHDGVAEAIQSIL